MTLQNGDSQRKSSVYNQTGQNYFEQLSSYNRMNSHLRRILMAQSVVDARNIKYIREKRLGSRSSSCSKSLDQILSRSEFIDGVAYDTEHHPIDLLRMRLGCNPNCLHMANKQSLEENYKSCSNIRCRGGSPRTSRRPEMKSELVRYSRTSTSGSPIRCPNRSYGSSRSSLLTGRRNDRQPEVESSRYKINDESRNGQETRLNRGFEAINETFSYDSSFESSSDTSGIDSPVAKNCECYPSRPKFSTSPERIEKEADRELKKLSNNEDAKYAKFLYNITQEIVINGLYTDQQLHEVFKKHMEMNCGCLDTERMLTEINQLKMSLNVKEFPEDKTVLKNVKHNEKTKRLEDSHRKSNATQAAKNANPEGLITEREVLVTLMEMKLDPQQVQTICRSLRNKMKETNGLELRDGTTQVIEEESKKKTENCECQCRGENLTSGPSRGEKRETNLSIKTEESQTDDKKPEVVSQASQVEGETREITTSTSVVELGKEARDVSSSNSELQKLTEVSQQATQSEEDEKIENGMKKRSKKKKISSIGKKSAEQNDQIDKKESQPTLESTQKNDNKIGQVRKSSAKKNGDSKKSSNLSRTKKPSNVDRKTSDSMVNKENLDFDKLGEKKESTKIETHFSDEEEATTTEIATEKDSQELQHEKIDGITDDELASLPEDISQAMDESLSTGDSEKSEKPRSPKAKTRVEKSSIIEPESSDERRNLHGIEESEEEEISTSLKLDPQVHRTSKSGNETDDFEGDDVVVGKTKKKSKFKESARTKKLSGPTSPNNQRSKSPNRDETLSPQKVHRKSPPPGGRTSDLGIRKPPLSIELLPSRRPTQNGYNDQNQLLRQSQTVAPDALPQAMKSPCDWEGSSCRRRQRNELIPRTCVREPITSIYREPSITTGSEFSLQSEEKEADSVTRNLEDFLNRDEIQEQSKLEAERETASFPWLIGKTDLGSKGTQEKLEQSGPRRDTIHRRTSLIRSVRIAMESLKKRRKSSAGSSIKSEENLADAASTWSPNLVAESSESLRRSKEEKLNSKISSDTSHASVSSSALKSPRKSEDREKLSRPPSIAHSPITLRSPRKSEDQEKSSRTPSISVSPITLRSPRKSEDRENLSRAPSISVPPITLKSPRDSKDREKSKTPSKDISSEGLISQILSSRGRCRPDCPGPWSSWKRSRRNSQSPNNRERHLSQSSQSIDSGESNEDN